MVVAVKKSPNHTNFSRNEDFSMAFFQKLKLIAMSIPRKRGLPRRCIGNAASGYQANNAEEYYRKAYFEFLYAMIAGLADRYDPGTSGLEEYLKLEKILLSGIVVEDVVVKYPELDVGPSLCSYKCSSRHTPNPCMKRSWSTGKWPLWCVVYSLKCLPY